MDKNSATIAALNDRLRTTFERAAGRVVLTQGIASLPERNQAAILSLVRGFNGFTPGNDPYGEHDFGQVEHDGQKAFFKIDYYDTSLQWASPDPTDPALTVRVMTVMLANEY